MTLKFCDIDDAFDKQLGSAPKMLDIESNVALWCLDKLGVSLFDNQIEIVEQLVNPQSKYICLAASRSSGKTFSTAVGIIKLCLDQAPYNVGVFAPKFEQAKRVVKQCEDILKSSKFVDEVLWAECTQSKIAFANGSSILSNSASEAANVEGVHVDMVCCDESQKISDLAISQKILPMIASSYSGKVVKLGVSLYKNHFYRSFNDSQYAHLLFDWTKCNNLLKGGSIVVKGVEYSKYVIDRMPFSIKQQVFPDNPELWSNTSDTTELDFQTQYMVKWVDSLSQVLSEQDQKLLVSGTHRWLNGGLVTDTYFAGLDTAGGSPNGSGRDLDFTSLSIWRKTGDLIKQKVFHAEWRGDITQAINEIYDLINPQSGKFKCQFTLVDYSNVGISLVESYKNLGIPIDGVTFGSTEKSSGKNLKNAMMDQFLFELRSGRLRYPGPDVDQIKILKKAQSEWHLMERHKGLGINDKLCLAWDTQIPILVDDKVVMTTIKELASVNSLVDLRVMSMDLKTKMPRVGKILRVLSTGVRPVVLVSLSNGTSFRCTEDHKVMLVTGKYQQAGKLKAETKLLPVPKYSYQGKKKQEIRVTSVVLCKEEESVYDLTVEKYHNFALSNEIFVHNCVPENEGHDDTVAADLLGVWAADKYTTFIKNSPAAMAHDLPMPQSVNSVLNPSFNSTGKPWWLEGFGNR